MEHKVGKFRYAKDCEGRTILITDVDRDKKSETYTCVGCGGEMVARQGEKNAWHFAHKKEECSYETYLHILGKTKIYEWLRDAEEVKLIVEETTVCSRKKGCDFFNECECRISRSTPIPLKTYYDNPKLEKRDEVKNTAFIPDIQLSHKGTLKEPLWIEIDVTHSCDNVKIKAGVRIIEFKVANERDVDRIIHHPIREGKKVKFYNFRTKKVHAPEDKPRRLFIYGLYPNGKFESREQSCLEPILHQPRFVAEIISSSKHNSELLSMVKTDYLWKLINKTCVVCRNVSYKKYRSPYCKYLKRKCKMPEAMTCSMFALDMYMCKQLEQDLLLELNFPGNRLWINDSWYRSLSD